MSVNKRKNLLTSLLSAHLSCGCGATRPKYPDVYQPKPKPKSKTKHKSSSSSSDDGETTTTTYSPATAQSCIDEPSPSSWPIEEEKESTTTKPSSCSTWNINIGESIAVVKESTDPYEDFRHSMLQMIFENEIFAVEDLRHLLQCFLRLNSPAHHHIILGAFFQVCDAVISSSTPPNSALDAK